MDNTLLTVDFVTKLYAAGAFLLVQHISTMKKNTRKRGVFHGFIGVISVHDIRFAVYVRHECAPMSGPRSTKVGQSHSLSEGSRIATIHGRRRVPRLATFSQTIASLSLLGGTRKGTTLPICVMRSVCCRIRYMLRTHRLLATDKKVLKVRISVPPPRSLNCREIPPSFPPNYAKICLFFDYSSANRTAENAQLCSEGGLFPGFFSGAHTRSPVSRRSSGECNAIRKIGP